MIVPTLTISDEKKYREIFLVYDSIGVKKNTNKSYKI